MRQDDIVQFLQVIDTELALHVAAWERLDLYLIGRSALILQYGLDLAVSHTARPAPGRPTG
jgi:hypothetical protein